MKTYRVRYKIVGTAWVDIEAPSRSEVYIKACAFDVEIPDGQVEWEFDEIKSITEQSE